MAEKINHHAKNLSPSYEIIRPNDRSIILEEERRKREMNIEDPNLPRRLSCSYYNIGQMTTAKRGICAFQFYELL